MNGQTELLYQCRGVHRKERDGKGQGRGDKGKTTGRGGKPLKLPKNAILKPNFQFWGLLYPPLLIWAKFVRVSTDPLSKSSTPNFTTIGIYYYI